MKSLSGKNKSLIQKFRFLKSDLEWRKVIVEESRQEFLDEVRVSYFLFSHIFFAGWPI